VITKMQFVEALPALFKDVTRYPLLNFCRNWNGLLQ